MLIFLLVANLLGDAGIALAFYFWSRAQTAVNKELIDAIAAINKFMVAQTQFNQAQHELNGRMTTPGFSRN